MAAPPPSVASAVPVVRTAAPPSPIVLTIEAALAANLLLEPKGSSAWDLFTQLAGDPTMAVEVARLRVELRTAMLRSGRAILSGDVRLDNVADRIDDYRRAGQLLSKARALSPDASETQALERLSAVLALVGLQFYDEAERSLTSAASPRGALEENALGLVYRGKLDDFRAERAFRKATELDPQWASPHYNLGLLYRDQRNPAALNAFRRAAELDQSNPAIAAALADEYFSLQRWREAEGAFQAAIKLDAGSDGLHTKLGHVLFNLGRRDEADREYKRATELRGARGR